VPIVANISDVSIIDLPIGFLFNVLFLCFVCPMQPVSLECPFLIAPSVFSTSETLATFGKQDTGQKQTKHIWITSVPKTNTNILQRQNIDEQLKYMVAHFLGLVQALQ
jgi:hypothetical protein